MSYRYSIFILISYFIFVTGSTHSAPTRIGDRSEEDYSLVLAPCFKAQRVSGPQNFGGNLFLTGARLYVNKPIDPSFGVIYTRGFHVGYREKLRLTQVGLTIEDRFRTDKKLRWRFTLGAGRYEQTSRIHGETLRSGTFAFGEPHLIWRIPFNRNIAFQTSLSYTLAQTSHIRVTGPSFHAELLFGRLEF